jgi:hypothetical protein
MAISAEQLNIILTAKDKAFAAAMDKNAKRIAGFAKNANKDLGVVSMGFSKLGGAAAAFLSVAAIQQLGVAVRDAANKLGDLKDAADAIGITTDAMQELTYAAQLSGVSADLLQTSLAKLSKNLGDAAMGGTSAKKALDTLGLSGASLAAMPLDKALGVVADKMSMIENPAQRAALATELFGKSGLAMVNMLADGSAGLNAMAAEAQSLGVVINRDVIANAAEAADKLDAMSMVVSANLTSALVNLMPFIISAAQGIAGITKAVNDFLFLDTQRTVQSNNALAYAKNATGDVAAAFKEYSKSALKLTKLNESPETFGDSRAGQDRADAIKTAELELQINTRLVVVAVDREVAEQKLDATYSASVQSVSDKNFELQNEIALLGLSKEEQIKKTASVQKAALVETLMTQAMAANGTVSETQRQSILALATQQEQLTIANEMGKIAQTGANKGMSDAAIAALKAKEALAFYQGQVEDLGLTMSEFETISSTIQSSMEDAFMGMVDGTSSAKDAFKSMASDIIKELYRVLVVQRLVGKIGTATQAGTGLIGAIGRGLGIGMASGGTLQAGQPAVVGEHGRELFVPSSAGRVLSVPQSKAAAGGGGGVTVMQTINITTGVQQTVRAEIRSLMPQIADSAKRAVLDAKQRGGTYGSAF